MNEMWCFIFDLSKFSHIYMCIFSALYTESNISASTAQSPVYDESAPHLQEPITGSQADFNASSVSHKSTVYGSQPYGSQENKAGVYIISHDSVQ